MKGIYINSIGKINITEGRTYINIDKEYIAALKELDTFSHINVLWWCNDFDNEEMRKTLETESPYKNSPEVMGIFATRSPVRPNPIAITAVKIISLDYDNGVIEIEYIDANNLSPVIDLKPYTPSLDRVESAKVPLWCSHWPKSLEESAVFDWSREFNF